MNLTLTLFIIFIIAIVMTMSGRGGGNFYVVALVLGGQSMHHAATTGQFILMLTAVAGMLVFQKNKLVDWKLALVIDPPTDILALAGGYFSGFVSGTGLKLTLAVFLALAGFLMMLKVQNKPIKQKRFGYWYRQFGEDEYVVNLWLAIPVTAAVGFISGAVGISGGSFKIPLMVLLCGVPMRIAVGTSSAMVAVTALMGFLGHSAQGHFNPQWAIPIAFVAICGGLLGGRVTIKTRPTRLKQIFAYTTLAASIFMVYNALFAANP